LVRRSASREGELRRGDARLADIFFALFLIS